MDPLAVSKEHPDTADVRALLERHFDLMRSGSPEESCHVMAPDTLLEAEATLYGIRRAGQLLGVGALTVIAPHHGELKSMHTLQEARGQGVARLLLTALLDHAKSLGLSQVSLETGTASEFTAARALYAAFGFSECPPFGAYTYDPLSIFMSKPIGS